MDSAQGIQLQHAISRSPSPGLQESLPLFFAAIRKPTFKVAVDAHVERMLAMDSSVVALSISGGKDSSAMARATVEHLRNRGSRAEIVLIHADLGEVEWQDSLPCCERLASHLNLPLIVARRNAGGMMRRWEQRWESSVRRYARLETVKLILPWSTPSMRFCTSELKTAVIDSELKKRFRGRPVIQAVGVRRAESAARSKLPVSKVGNARLNALTWNPIVHWSTPEVFEYLEPTPHLLHEAYTTYGSSRVSCAFCIMGSGPDLQAALAAPYNHTVYKRMVELELRSTFAFQGARWLADLMPQLHETMPARIVEAKARAAQRIAAESELPSAMLYEKGRPTSMPSASQAEHLASVRKRVAQAVGIEIDYTSPPSIIARYVELAEAAR